MGWQIGYDEKWKRDIGYGVPAICDQPECSAEIDRGLSHVCGTDPFGGDLGCGLYFCGGHLFDVSLRNSAGELVDVEVCIRCRGRHDPYDAKPDTDEWRRWKLTDASWQQWRDENPVDVAQIQAALAEATT